MSGTKRKAQSDTKRHISKTISKIARLSDQQGKQRKELELSAALIKAKESRNEEKDRKTERQTDR